MSRSHRADPAVKGEVAAETGAVQETCRGGGGEAAGELAQTLGGWLERTESELAKASTLAELVKVLIPRLYALGVVILEAVLEQRDAKWRDPKQQVACPKCSKAMKKNRASIKRKTLLGEVSHKRTSWECAACGHTYLPVVDAELQVGHGANRHESGFVSLLLHMVTALQFAKGPSQNNPMNSDADASLSAALRGPRLPRRAYWHACGRRAPPRLAARAHR